jgi:hypothetical protein
MAGNPKPSVQDGTHLETEQSREYNRQQGELRERNRIIDLIKRQVCFDALADHDAMETFRHAHPEVVGRCSHHGGKCTDLLLLISELESK